MWYVSRDLATIVENDDGSPTIQLNFEPRGRDTDDYMLRKKANRCVVCGSKKIKTLTKHHVIPSMYRRLFPEKLKERSSHDVVVICRECHNEYESQYADALKQMFANNFNAPFNKPKRHINKFRAIMMARTIVSHWDVLPGDRVEELLNDFEDITGIEPDSFDDLYAYIEKTEVELEIELSDNHASIIVNAFIDNLEQFAIMWRRNFIEKMNPKFMPEGWDIYRTLGI
jgi:hypothetical protein